MRKIEAVVVDFFLFSYIGWCVLFLATRLLANSSDPSFDLNVWFLLFIAGVGILGMVISRRQGVTVGEFLSGRREQNESGEIPSFWQRPVLWTSALFIAVTSVVGWIVTQMSVTDLLSYEGFSGTLRIFKALFAPKFEIFPRAMEAIIETIFMSFMATAIAVPIAFLLSFLAANNLMKSGAMNRFIYSLVRLTVNFCRSIEPVIWAIVFSVWVGIGPFAGMLALCVHSVVSLVKLYSEQIEVIDNGPLEAMESVGANKLLVIAYGVVPQIVTPYISYTIYRWDINVRMATIVGLVGGGGIGTLLMQYQGLARWNEVGLIIFMIAFVVWFMDLLSAKIRKALQ